MSQVRCANIAVTDTSAAYSRSYAARASAELQKAHEQQQAAHQRCYFPAQERVLGRIIGMYRDICTYKRSFMSFFFWCDFL
jgi:hypothetical protein